MLYPSHHPDLIDAIKVYQYWRDLPGAKPRAMVNPLELGGRVLSCISLCRSLHNGTDIRYDLISRTLGIIAPRLKPGSLASEALQYLQGPDPVYDLLCSVVCTQEPRAYEAVYYSLEGIMRQSFLLLLPLGLDPERPSSEDLLIGAWLLTHDSNRQEEELNDLTGWFLDEAGKGLSS